MFINTIRNKDDESIGKCYYKEERVMRMGIYFNPSNQNFYEAANKEIYVDKSLLIEHIEYLRIKVNKYIYCHINAWTCLLSTLYIIWINNFMGSNLIN